MTAAAVRARTRAKERGDGDGCDRRGETELELVVLADRPGLDTAGAQRAREILGEAVQREDAFGADGVDEAQQIGEVGVVRKRERRVALVAVNGAGVHRPAADHGGAGAGDFAEKRRALRLRRADHGVPGDFGGVEGAIRGKSDAQFAVDAGEPERLRVQHHRQPGLGEAAQQFLALAETVTEKDGNLPVVEAAVAEGGNVGENAVGGRKGVVRPAERRFHHEHIGARGGAELGRAAGAQFEIAGIEERTAVSVGKKALSRAEDVACRMQRHRAVRSELFRLAEGQNVFDPLARHAGAHQARGAGGAKNLAVRRDVVGVGVGDKRARLG